MTRRLNAALAVVLLLAPTHLMAQNAATEMTRTVSQQYLDLDTSLKFDALADVYAPDAQFLDPTGEVFPGIVSQGTIKGAKTIIELQKSWGLTGVDFDIDASFFVGEYALHRGTYNTQFSSSDTWTPIPFITIHRVQNERITERLDFGEYIESFGLGDQFNTTTETTRTVAQTYLRAYLDRDFDTQTELAAADIQFQDPTAQIFGPPMGELFQSAETLIDRRKQVFQNIQAFDLEVEKSFVANHHAVYMGTTTYTLASGQRYAQPAVFIIEVRDGKVTQHWDFVDYTVGPVAN